MTCIWPTSNDSWFGLPLMTHHCTTELDLAHHYWVWSIVQSLLFGRPLFVRWKKINMNWPLLDLSSLPQVKTETDYKPNKFVCACLWFWCQYQIHLNLSSKWEANHTKYWKECATLRNSILLYVIPVWCVLCSPLAMQRKSEFWVKIE